LRNACNQKTARNPVSDYSEGEVGHTLRELQELELVREEWGSRTPRYMHLVGKALNLHSKGIALLGVLMLRGPQTPGELKTNCQRLFAFDDLDDVLYALQDLQKRTPPLITALPRQPGQKEGRYAHLLCGEPDIPAPAAPRAGSAPASAGLEARVAALESELADARERLAKLEAKHQA
jgi:hypothetical protein